MHKRIQNPLEYQRSGFIIVNGFQLLTTLSKSSILHICLASEYASLFMHRDYFQNFFASVEGRLFERVEESSNLSGLLSNCI